MYANVEVLLTDDCAAGFVVDVEIAGGVAQAVDVSVAPQREDRHCMSLLHCAGDAIGASTSTSPSTRLRPARLAR